MRARSVRGRQGLGRVMHSEWVKIRSLRSTWISSAIAMALTVAYGAGLIIAYARDGQPDAANAIYTGYAFGQLVVAVLGALAITGEYATGQIRSTLAAVPRRGWVLMAKATVTALFSFCLGAVSVLVAWLVSAPFMEGRAGSLTDPQYLGFFWGTGLSFAGIALMSMGLGYLIRSTAGAITTVVCLLFVVDLPLAIMGMRWEWVNNVRAFGPGYSAQAVADPFALRVSWGGSGIEFLEQWQAVAVFAAWALVPMILGWIALSRRDA